MATNNAKQNMLAAGKVLTGFAAIASALVGLTFFLTEDRIAENEREALLKSLHVLLPPEAHDNDIYTDTISLNDKTLSYRNKPFTVYRARKHNKNIAAIFNVTAPDGYSGPIKMLVAINNSGKILGVRAISHRETPGLGDAIDIEKSNWIKNFDGRTLSNPGEKKWKVKKDGGAFDQLTGATITPRAVVKTTYNTLKYFSKHKTAIFAKSGGKSNGQ